jgi:predicted nucleotidyltransferase
MNPVLFEKLNKLELHLKKDERCVGVYLGGSIAGKTADEFSDVDAYLLVRAADYAEFKKDFYTVCQTIFGKILIWLPEAESPDFVNYAFLFPAGDDLLLYDIALLTAEEYFKAPSTSPKQILFDRTGRLAQTPQEPPPAPDQMKNLLSAVNNYWVYMYLNGKYFRRADLFKMLYVQNTLFHNHLNILRASHPDMGCIWWAKDIQHLPAAKQKELLIYFSPPTLPALTEAIQNEMALFSADAQAACQKHNLEYPTTLEQGVKKHLNKMKVTG